MSVTKRKVEAFFYGNPAAIADRILFVKRDTRLDQYKALLTDDKEFGNVWRGITGAYRGRPVTVIAAGIGQPMAGDAVYALDRPDSVCLYSGTCGGLRESLGIGDYFIARDAVPMGGSPFPAVPSPSGKISGDPKLLDSLLPLLQSRVVHVESGTAYSTDSAVREVDPDFWRVLPAGCGIIEMASAAFYAAARASRKQAAAYFWVSDLPTRGKSFFDPPQADDLRIKKSRADRSASLDLELLSAL
jgi:purine-nucleoside phosphorylase